MDRKELLEIASKYLQSKGYTVECRDWTCKDGTADLVARMPNGVLVIAEVMPSASATGWWNAEKRAEREAVAASYADHAGLSHDALVRHDLIAVSEAFGGSNVFVRHYADMDQAAA